MFSSSENDKSDSSSGQYVYQFIIFILWAIVYGRTDKAVFDALGVGEFYTLAECIVWGTTAIVSALVLLGIISAVAISFEIECCLTVAKSGGVLAMLGFIGVTITNFVFLCIICANDVHHYFIGYKTFWRERAFNYSILSTNHTVGHPIVNPGQVVAYPSAIWPYEMADIIVRIQWGFIFAALFILATVGACGLIGYIISKITSCCSKTT
jgi:hypothetical protein